MFKFLLSETQRFNKLTSNLISSLARQTPTQIDSQNAKSLILSLNKF